MKIVMAAMVAGLLAGAARAQEEDPARRVRDKLASTRINLEFSNARLADVIAYLQEFSGLNFHLDPSVLDTTPVTIKLKDVSIRTALKLILKPRDLGCVYREGVLVIASKKTLSSQTVTRVYDVRDLIMPIADFPGPRMELAPPGGIKVDVIWIPDPEPESPITPEFLSDIVQTHTGREAWDGSADTSITQVNGLLVVSQTRAVHEEIRRILDLLRECK